MGIAYDMDGVLPDVSDNTVPPLSYGAMPKEKSSGNIIPMPQRKVMYQMCRFVCIVHKLIIRYQKTCETE